MKLPLFPLNLVLFPGMPQLLHIFEDRYKQMINQCRENDSPFGIVLIKSGFAEGSSLAKPHLIGTTAHITHLQEMDDGRMNIRVEGQERFRVESLDYNTNPYLTGEIEMMAFDRKITPPIVRGRDLLHPLIERYLKILEKIGTIEFDKSILPQDPVALAYLGAMLLDADNNTKQQLLEAPNIKKLLSQLINHYRREMMILDILLSPPTHLIDDDFPFSQN